ncbi:MAG: histidine phosphatase family protein [Firmicutes bacterium]|nr:histidine phosphatase family protein [Bacillota bacterium]
MIFFVRHGETEDNVQDILTGHNEILLTNNGLKQAEEAAEEIKDVDFAMCYCSPLIRTKQTLEKLLKHFPNLKVVYDNRIIERDYGEASGKHSSICSFNRWARKAEIAFKNFESVDDVFERAKDFYDEVIEKHKGQNILVVSHSGFGRVSHCYFNGFPADGDLMGIKIKNAKVITYK